MFVKPLLSQPEGVSTLYFIIHLILLIVAACLVRSAIGWLFILAAVFMIFYVGRKIAHGRCFTPPPGTNLAGQTIVVTGAASGIGRVSAVDFAKFGATVVVGIRGQRRAEETAAELQRDASKFGAGTVIGYDLDLSSLSSVKRFAEQVLQRRERITVLLNNAGLSNQTHALTADGFEAEFGVNHLGHFYLTELLLPSLIESRARIVNVSSMGHCFVDPQMNYEFGALAYDSQFAYGRSKLAQIWHVTELQRRYGERGVNAYALHPGLINTNILRQMPTWTSRLLHFIVLLIGKSTYRGAQTSLYCALSADAVPGKLHGDCCEAKTSPLAYDVQLAKECWEYSEKAVHEKITPV